MQPVIDISCVAYRGSCLTFLSINRTDPASGKCAVLAGFTAVQP